MASKDDFETPEGDFVSPSQIEVWLLCQRKWAFRYIAGIDAPSHPSAQKGTAVHTVLEQWLAYGTVIDLDATVEIDGKPFKPGPIAAAMIKHLPHPGTCGTERHIFVRTPVAHYQGHIDWDVLKLEIPKIGDHKTTSNFKWAKTAEDLKKDPQANIYAAATMAETGADAVDLQWTYGRTVGKPVTKVVHLRLYRAEVERNFDELDETSAEILAAKAAGLPPLEHDFNANACEAYGGCFHRDTCNLSPTERLMAIMAKQTLAEKMAARKAALAAGQPGGSAAPPPVGGAGINAPEGPETAKPETEAEKLVAATKPQTLAEKMAAKAAATEVATTPPAAAATKKRGRPPGKSKAANADATPAAATVAPIVGHGTRTKGATPPAGGEESPVQIVDLKSFALFIDCLPVKGGLFIQASEVCEPARVEVAATHNVGDYRLIDFGKAGAYLRAALDRRLTAEPITGIGIVLDTRTDLGKDTLETFSKHAGLIVRAF
ncbi:hypothetical protein LCGC14_0375120 [marine sediment metagenome]|uniref:PD-(D/E)XK endonuclease-like domain-containing protein n=1 Tax=marine sediment metagenome TaxID=412755 RepID=A0A0F9T3Y6_9ZZZZ